jgi:hydroxymethylpyrimidine/phosphomethylpyrimidine kinase
LTPPPIALTIAGSDSSGGAGIQADIKTFSSLGVYSASVITNITAQNTCNVSTVHALPITLIEAQLRAVFDDLNVTSVKIGMLNTTSIIHLVSNILQEYRPKYIVLDPVMISTSGKTLIETTAIEALKTALFPMSTLITPNIHEAAALLNSPLADSKSAMYQTIKALNRFGGQPILLKGGHLIGDQCIDLLLENGNIHEFSQTKILTKNTHGTGCTLSSAISAYLALGYSMLDAVAKANVYLNNAILHADILNVGKGGGPVHHFYHQW